MSLVEKNRQAIESNPELSAKVRGLWARSADTSEFYEVLKEAGFDVDRENVEDIVAGREGAPVRITAIPCRRSST